MRPLRSRRIADDHAAALARARVAHLAGSGPVAGRARAGGGAHAARGVHAAGAAGSEGRRDDAGDGLGFAGAGDRSDLDGGEPADEDRREADDDGADRIAEPGGSQFGEAGGSQFGEAVRDRLPVAVGPERFARLGLQRVHLAVIALVVVLGMVAAAVLFALARPEVVPIEPAVAGTGTAPPAEEAGEPVPPVAPPVAAEDPQQPPGGPIVVHVAGLVGRPGVVELPPGSRVVDAIEAAGGATADADLTPINLARVLADGEQVLVTADPPEQPPPGQSGAGTGGGVGGGSGGGAQDPGGPGAPPGRVNLNTATAAELETLPGIGPALAGRILEWRTRHGRFTAVDELREVSGIGAQRFAQLEPLVTL